MLSQEPGALVDHPEGVVLHPERSPELLFHVLRDRAASDLDEQPAEEEGDPVTRLVDGVLLPNLANHVAARLAELASSA